MSAVIVPVGAKGGFVAQLVDQPVGRVGANRDVVTGDVEVLDPLLAETAVDHGDPDALIGDRLDRRGQRLALEGQHHQRVDAGMQVVEDDVRPLPRFQNTMHLVAERVQECLQRRGQHRAGDSRDRGGEPRRLRAA